MHVHVYVSPLIPELPRIEVTINVYTILQEEDEIMEATEGLAEASDINAQSVRAFAQLASSDRVSGHLRLAWE